MCDKCNTIDVNLEQSSTFVMDEKRRVDLRRKFDSLAPIDFTRDDLLTIIQAFTLKKVKSNKPTIDAAISLYFDGCDSDKKATK